MLFSRIWVLDKNNKNKMRYIINSVFKIWFQIISLYEMGQRPESRYFKEGKRITQVMVMVISGNGYVIIIAFFKIWIITMINSVYYF